MGKRWVKREGLGSEEMRVKHMMDKEKRRGQSFSRQRKERLGKLKMTDEEMRE